MDPNITLGRLGLQGFQHELEARSKVTIAFEALVCAMWILFTFTGNSLVLWIVYKNPLLRTIPNQFVISLAVSDLVMGALGAPPCFIALALGRAPLGAELCQMQGFLIVILARVSLQTMALVAINRYFLIVRPNLYRKIFTPLNTKLMIVFVWVVTCIEPIPYLSLGYRYFFHPAKAFCFPDSRMHFVVLTGYAIVSLPMPILVFCYYKVFATIQRHRKNLKERQEQNALPTAPSVEDINVTLTLFVTVVGLFFCWIPIAIVDFIDYVRGSLGSMPREVYVVYLFFGQLSTTINPIIYGVMNKSFREAYKSLFQVSWFVPPCYKMKYELKAESTPAGSSTEQYRDTMATCDTQA